MKLWLARKIAPYAYRTWEWCNKTVCDHHMEEFLGDKPDAGPLVRMTFPATKTNITYDEVIGDKNGKD